MTPCKSRMCFLARSTLALISSILAMRPIIARYVMSRDNYLRDNVAQPANRPDELVFVHIVDLVPQVAHVHIHNVRGAIETLIPYVFQDHCPREDPAGVCHEVLKHSIFF